MAFSALVAGDAVGQDLQHDGASLLLQGSGDCATPPRFERRLFSISERSVKVRCGMVLQINTFAKRQAIDLRVHSTYEQTDCRAEHVA